MHGWRLRPLGRIEGALPFPDCNFPPSLADASDDPALHALRIATRAHYHPFPLDTHHCLLVPHL